MIVRALLKTRERFDYRPLDSCRLFEYEELENGYYVRMGMSHMLATYQLCRTRPFPDKPQEGIVTISVYGTNRKCDVVSNLLRRIYIKNRCIDLESLCIKFNEEVYSLTIDLKILSSDGGLCAIAVGSINLILRKMEIATNFHPRCFLYSSVEGVLVRDPTEAELDESDWTCIVVMRSYREFLYVEKLGRDCSGEELFDVIDRAHGACASEGAF
jgi:exosome complex component RRP45